MNRFGRPLKPLVWSMALVLAALLPGCGGGGGDNADPAAAASAAAAASIAAAVAANGGAAAVAASGGAGTTAPAGSGGTVCTGAACVSIGAAGNLGAAGGYVILAKSGVSTIPSSAVTGNIGLSPAAKTFLTGWSQADDVTNTFATAPQVAAPGRLFAANNTGGTTSVDLGTAVLNMEGAYTAAAGKATAGGGLPAGGPQECPGVGAMSDVNNALAPGGSFPVTGLPAGVYTCAVNVTIPGNLTLNGSATDVWVFKITGKLTQANATLVTLTGGALPKNVFWQVSGVVTIGTTARMQGVILAQTNIAVQTGATIKGRLLAQTAVTLDQATVTVP